MLKRGLSYIDMSTCFIVTPAPGYLPEKLLGRDPELVMLYFDL